MIGVILSGTLDDGTSGLAAIKQGNGIAIVQDPSDALYPGMPQSAIDHVAVNYVLPLADIPSLLIQLAHEPVEETPFPSSDGIEYETDIVELDMTAVENEDRPGSISEFVCPECGGNNRRRYSAVSLPCGAYVRRGNAAC